MTTPPTQRPVRPRRRGGGAGGLVLLLALLAACSTDAGPEEGGAGQDGPPGTSSGASPSAPPTPGRSATREQQRSGPRLLAAGETMGAGEGPVTLDRYFDQVPAAGGLTLGREREGTASRTSYDVTYRSDGLTITGVLDLPVGDGPFPAVVLAHGWIDRDAYEQGQGMTRERAWLADAGYAALHVDFRGHAGSDEDPELVEDLYLGYAVDTLGAVRALRDSDLPIDGDRIALMGRSMGGMVVLQALEMAPGYVEAGILYSAQSSLEAENYARWGAPGFDYAQDFVDAHGTPQESPERWRDMSTRPFVDRVAEPVLMIHGRRDQECPPAWAEATHEALVGAGVSTRLAWFDDGHAFGPEFGASMREALGFLRTELG